MSDRNLFFKHLAQTSSFPLALEIDHAQGLYMTGKDGKRYMDLISGISVSAVGHRHPRVIQAIKDQLDRHMHLMVYGEFIQSPQVALASRLADLLPASLNNVYLVNSGSEAIEGALKLAKRHTGRSEIVSFKNAYHGSSHGALSVTGNESLKRAFRPLLPGILHLDFGSINGLSEIGERTACVLVETIQGEAGVRIPQPEFLQALRARCNETGTLLILDEVQAGLGRTGKLWAFEHFGIVPDVLVLAKGLGGGMPIGAFIASRNIMQSLTHDPVLGHISTFGGNAVCAASALATLNLIVEQKLWENAAVRGQQFKKLINHSRIVQTRGLGLLMAIEFKDFSEAKRIVDRCIEKGLLTDWFLFADNCLRIAPPLNITPDETEKAAALVVEAVDEILG